MTNRSHLNNRKKPLVGISACLMGEPVRYDGGDKYQPLYQQALTPYLELSPFCPEVSAGLGVPRPPVQLVKTDQNVKALGVEVPTLDVTERLLAASRQFIDSQSTEHQTNLSGFILKSRSPSCGYGSTPIHNVDREPISQGNGLFSECLYRQFPHLAIVEESWLNSQWRCQLFVLCCLANHSPPLTSFLNQNFHSPPKSQLIKNLLELNEEKSERLWHQCLSYI